METSGLPVREKRQSRVVSPHHAGAQRERLILRIFLLFFFLIKVIAVFNFAFFLCVCFSITYSAHTIVVRTRTARQQRGKRTLQNSQVRFYLFFRPTRDRI